MYVDVVGHGYPLLLMHGGPGADHWTLLPFRQLADQFTLVFYDHRCNGRSQGVPVSSMTFENLTADADALRRRLSYERWAVLGHSFGGHVALEYALRYPGSVSHLVLVDTGGDSRWSRHNAAGLLASRGYSPAKVELVRRWFNGEFPPPRSPRQPWSSPGGTTSSSRPSTSANSPPPSPTRPCSLSSARATTRTPSSPQRSCGPSGTSSPHERRRPTRVLTAGWPAISGLSRPCAPATGRLAAAPPIAARAAPPVQG